LLTDDPQLQEHYAAFLQKSLRYVVSSVKFLSYSTDPAQIIRPFYLPYKHIAGFNKNHDETLAGISRLAKMDKENPDRFVQGRVKYGLSLHPMDAYREIFNGNGREACDYKILPMQYPLIAHFDPERDKFFNALHDRSNASVFIRRAGGKNTPSVEQKSRRMIFYAETFGNHVYAKYKKGYDLRYFYAALEENCDAISEASVAYRNMATILGKYLAG